MANGLYSKATRGLRQSDVIKDQHFKLVFVYPLLTDRSLSKYTDLVRNFLSTTMLKELFVSNALNLVNIAAQIHPLTDEKGKAVDVQSTISNASMVSGGSMGQLGGTYAGTSITGQAMVHPLEHMKYELASRIKEKTAVIRKYLAADPRLKNLNPYVEMITMDNLVDVPVIVGTKSFDIDTAIMQFVFLVSVADKLSLKNGADVEKIFDRIEQTDPGDAWTLLNNLVPKEPRLKDKIVQWLKNLSPAKKWAKERTPAAMSIRQIATQIRAQQEALNANESFQIVQTAQSNISQARLFFKFCYDRNFLKTQFGQDISQGQISTRITKVSGQIQNVFNTMYRDFTSSLTRFGNPAILSMINMLYPTESGIDELQIVNNYVFTRMLENVRDLVFDDLMVFINAAIESGGIEGSSARIKELKGLCIGEFTDSDKVLGKSNMDIADNEIRSPVAGFDEMSRFLEILSKVSSSCRGQSRTVEQSLGSILGGEATSIVKRIYSAISNELSALLDELASHYNTVDFNNVAFFRAVEASQNAPEFEPNQKTITMIKKQVLDAVAPYIYFIFMYHLQIALCNYVSIVDIEIETAKNDVLDHPNYTLVVPVETLESIANALVAKSWKQLIKTTSGKVFVGAVGDNYVKGIVKFMKLRLGVPNLVVIDDKKGDVFYQLMHQSVPQKTKLKTLETFIQLTTKQELQGQLPSSAFPSGYY